MRDEKVGIMSPPYQNVEIRSNPSMSFGRTFRKVEREERLKDRYANTGYNQGNPRQIGNLKVEEREGAEMDLKGCGSPLQWEGLYAQMDNWKSMVTPQSYVHPAKMSPLLCQKIFEHLEELELIDKGSLVCDFMAGTGTTNIIASLRGYQSVSVELEPRFVRIEAGNRARFKQFSGVEPDWKIIQGDSRNLSKMLGRSAGVISPPYQDMKKGDGYTGTQKRVLEGKYGGQRPDAFVSKGNVAAQGFAKGYSTSPKNIGNLPSRVGVMSPSYGGSELRGKREGDQGWFDRHPEIRPGFYGAAKYQSKGNVGHLQTTGVISPPYQDVYIASNPKGSYAENWRRGRSADDLNAKFGTGYNERNPRNIGNLKVGILSPPYQDSINSEGDPDVRTRRALKAGHNLGNIKTFGREAVYSKGRYGRTRGQIGALRAGVTSPPYFQQAGGKPHAELYPRSPKDRVDANARHSANIYGGSKGQVGSAKLSAITSPPYITTLKNEGYNKTNRLSKLPMKRGGSQLYNSTQGYGKAQGNVGNEANNETYESAMLQIYSEAYRAGISPLVTVTKNPTRSGKLVRLDLITADLLTQVGYEIFDCHQAVLFKSHDVTSVNLDMGIDEKVHHKGRIGFFKKLSLNKGSVAASWEDVLFAG